MSKKIIFIGNYRFPFGSACAERIRAYSIAFANKGYSVDVLATSMINSRHEDGWSAVNDKIRYKSTMNVTLGTRLGFINKIVCYLNCCINLCKELINFYKDGGRCIFLYERRFSFLLIHSIFRRYFDFRIIVESVEWFDSSHFKYGVFNLRYWDEYIGRRLFVPMFDGVICITRYIRNKYQSLGVPAMIIPAVVEADCNPCVICSNTKANQIRMLYIGSAKVNDGLDVVFDAIKKLIECSVNIKLSIVGDVSKSLYYQDLKCNYVELFVNGSIEECGYVDENEKRQRESESDFLLLLRKRDQAAEAAFPTRLAELLLTGVMVITTDVGDVSLYLKDNYDAKILPHQNAVSHLVAFLLDYSTFIKKDKYKIIGERGRFTALNNFVAEGYIDELEKFMHIS